MSTHGNEIHQCAPTKLDASGNTPNPIIIRVTAIVIGPINFKRIPTSPVTPIKIWINADTKTAP